jgi:hypothetical protein
MVNYGIHKSNNIWPHISRKNNFSIERIRRIMESINPITFGPTF